MNLPQWVRYIEEKFPNGIPDDATYELHYPYAKQLSDLESERDALKAEVERLADALKKTSEPTGPYSMDHLQHAENCLAEVIRISQEALKEYENATK